MIPNGFGKISTYFGNLFFLLTPHEIRIFVDGCFENAYPNDFNESYMATYVFSAYVIL
jgi:hypothetical protein